ncbi:MAG: ABC transporter substrate-binding protein [Lachnospiraceae bacterium]
MKKKILSAMMCVVMCATMVTGCGGSDDPTVSQPAASEKTEAKEETTGEEIAVCGGSEDSMDINTGTAGTLEGLSACRHIYEGLYKLDADGKVVLGQASDVKVSEDGLTYTFTLRDDIKWSDGQAVKADDFIYGWQYLKDCASDYSSLMDMVSDAKAVDDQTLELKLAYACSYLPNILAFPSAYPVRKDYVEKYGESYATDPDKSVYNGAYEVAEWKHQQEMVMKKREDYYDAKAITTSQVSWELMTDPSTMLASYESGDIMYSNAYPSEEAERLKDKGLHFVPGYNTCCAMFNVGEKGPEVLKDAKVRKALSLAIDRERLIKIRNLDDELADTYTPSGLTNDDGTEFNTTVEPWFKSDDYEGSCEEAKKLLAEAGYEGGKDFPALTYIVSDDDRKEIAEGIASDWKEVLGIDTVKVETVDGFYAQRGDQDYDIAYYGWYMDYPDISNMLSTMTTGSSDSGYSNADYDAAYSKATAETDVETQWKDYAECEKILADDTPVIPLYHAKSGFLFDDTKYDGLVDYCGNYYFGYVHQK